MSDSEHPSISPFSKELSFDEELDIEQAFTVIEAKLQHLKDRHKSIQKSQEQQPQLQEQLQQLLEEANQTEAGQSEQPEKLSKLREEISQIQEQLQMIEVDLESRLMNVLTLPDKIELFKFLTLPEKADWFWHFLKYTGLGFFAALFLGHLNR
jgi:succinate dehydrogenase/fumarate reductase flavoprotein subunit